MQALKINEVNIEILNIKNYTSHLQENILKFFN